MYSEIDLEAEETHEEVEGEDVEAGSLQNRVQNHRRSTYTQDEARILKFIRYMRFSSACWLTYLFPATIALLVGIILDHDAPESCDKYLLAWAIIQTILQICHIITKSATVILYFQLSSSPEPEEIEEFTEGKAFAMLAWMNRVLYILWIGWYSCGCLWILEALIGVSDCRYGLLFDIILSLITVQLLFVIGMGLLCCCSTCLVCLRIIQILIRLSREEEQGIIGLLNTGATKEVIQQTTNSKTFSPGLIEESSAMCAICLEDYSEGEEIRFLPCSELHHFHVDCVDQWLERRKCCPLCKVSIDRSEEKEPLPEDVIENV